MNLRRLAVFVKVVDEGSFSGAARALDRPRSAVSQAISGLERELGVRLLNRTSRAMTVTEAGATLHHRAGPALRTIDEASLEVTDRQGPLRGRVRLTAPVELGTRLLEPVLSRFLAKHAGVDLDVVLTSKVLDLAEAGVDLAVRNGPLHDESLVARRLGGAAAGQSAGLFASPAYLGAHGQPRRLRELEGHAAVVVRSGRGRASWRLTGPDGPATVEVRARLSVDSWGYALRAALAGVGVTLLPTFLCAAELKRGQLVRVLPSWGLPESTLWLVYPSGRYLPRAVAAVRDALLSAFPPETTEPTRPRGAGSAR